MPPIQKKQYKTLYFSIIFLLCCIFLLLPLNGSQRNGESFLKDETKDDTKYTTTTDIWTTSSLGVYDYDGLSDLLETITGDSNLDMEKLQSLASSKLTAEDMRQNNGGKEIVVDVGYLNWTPVYLSTDRYGNPILTLWLSESTQLYMKNAAGFDRYGRAAWTPSGITDTSVYPLNMYGTSLMRADILNNGGDYLSKNGLVNHKINESTLEVFRDFVPKPGEYNDMTDCIVKPKDVPWQENGQSAIIQFGLSNDLHNENWSTNSSDSYAQISGFDTWKDDFLWLPSLTETGYTDVTSFGFRNKIGIWNTSKEQRRNVKDTWLRSGISTSSVCILYGSNGNYSTDSTSTNKYAVRPAFHLNLKSALEHSGGRYGLYVTLYRGYTDKYYGSYFGNMRIYYGQKGEKVSVPTRPGYTFKGFYTEMNCGGKQYIDKNGDFIKEWDELTTTELYGGWEANSFNITFEGNGGYINNGLSYKQTIFLDSSVEINPNREGYDFLYFTQEKDAPFSTTFTLDDKNMFTLNTEFGENGSSVTLYAQWKIKSYNITFKGNYGTINKRTDYTDTYEYGEKITLKKNVDGDGGKNLFYLYKLGYQFSKFDVGTISDDTFTIPDLGKDQAEVSITAQWIERSYTFEFNAGANTFKDGTGPSSQTKLYSAKLTMPDAQSEGYILAGWYAQNTSGRTYTYKQVVPVNELTQGKENEQTITLYAQWEETWANYAEMPDKVSEYSNEYLVSSPEHLGWIANELQNGKTLADYIFRQTKNIDLNDYTWFNGGTFEGQYYGNGYYILNIHSSTNENVAKYDYQGLFAQTYYSVLQNIHILSGNIVGNDNVGAIVGKAENTVIRNCVNHANVFGSCWVAGIVGYKKESNSSSASATISGCVNYGQITGDKYNCYLGGIVGQINNSTIDACYVRANISGYSYSAVGGIAGFTNDNTIISSCAFVGESAANGIVGNGNNNSFVIGCLVDSTKADNLLPDGAENCVAYVNGELKTAEPTDKSTWTKINGKWFPSGLAWIG